MVGDGCIQGPLTRKEFEELHDLAEKQGMQAAAGIREGALGITAVSPNRDV
jgi:hypothetical protein